MPRLRGSWFLSGISEWNVQVALGSRRRRFVSVGLGFLFSVAFDLLRWAGAQRGLHCVQERI